MFQLRISRRNVNTATSLLPLAIPLNVSGAHTRRKSTDPPNTVINASNGRLSIVKIQIVVSESMESFCAGYAPSRTNGHRADK